MYRVFDIGGLYVGVADPILLEYYWANVQIAYLVLHYIIISSAIALGMITRLLPQRFVDGGQLPYISVGI